MSERDIYIAIMRAAARGDGLRLSARECFDLSQDDAIQTVASNNLSLAEAQAIFDGQSWSMMDPRKEREPGIWYGGESEQARKLADAPNKKDPGPA